MRSVRSVDEPGEVCPGDGSVRDADAGVGCGQEGPRLEVDSRGVDHLSRLSGLGCWGPGSPRCRACAGSARTQGTPAWTVRWVRAAALREQNPAACLLRGPESWRRACVGRARDRHRDAAVGVRRHLWVGVAGDTVLAHARRVLECRGRGAVGRGCARRAGRGSASAHQQRRDRHEDQRPDKARAAASRSLHGERPTSHVDAVQIALRRITRARAAVAASTAGAARDQELRWRTLCAGESDQLDADRRPDDRDRDRQPRLHGKYRQPGDRGAGQHDELAEPAGVRADDHTHHNERRRARRLRARLDARVSERSP